MAPRSVRIDPARFRALREIRGYQTQAALSAASGVDPATISRMSRLPGPYETAKVRAIARALELPDLRLLGVSEEDARALEAEASVREVLSRLLDTLSMATHNRATGQPNNRTRRRPVVGDFAPAR